MLISNDFLKTRAGFAYVRECVKCCVSVGYAVNLRPLHLYEVEFHEDFFRGTLYTTDLGCTLRACHVQRGSACVREYNMATCQYDTVYVGATETLRSWVIDGELLVTEYCDDVVAVDFDVHLIDTCTGDARKIWCNKHMYDPNHRSCYSVIEDAAASPYNWLVANAHGRATEVFRASAEFMRDVCGSELPF